MYLYAFQPYFPLFMLFASGRFTQRRRAPKEPESLDDILGLEIKDREIQRKKPYSTFSRRPDEDGEIPVSCHQRKKRKHPSTGDMFVIVRYFNLS